MIRRQAKTRILLACLLAIVGSVTIIATTRDTYAMEKVSNVFSRHITERFRRQKNATKWIVVTSIQYPTQDVINLASQSGWNVVVVADRKTPNDWQYPNVHFLSVLTQLEFGEFAESLPFNSYTRKNIGYLYAIKQGAEWIYDTDDDNKPYGRGLDQFDYGPTISGLRFKPNSTSLQDNLFNPYQFYGFKEMWPRGFPLEYLQNHTNGQDNMILCHRMKTAAVQQGVVHNDPDVDAIYRLLHADNKGLHVTFNSHAPSIVLEKGTYSPWNSQNTLFHYKAFFTMFLPTTVAFRVTDIWRSYFAQKLLHIIGENIAFYPVNAIQVRNAHNYLKDMDQEIDVYEKSGQMVAFLDSWNCSHKMADECTLELAVAFVKEEFFKKEDYDLIVSWIAALKELQYTFPAVVTSVIDPYPEKKADKFGNCRRANIDLGTERYSHDLEHRKEEVIAEQVITNYNEVLHWCGNNSITRDRKLPLPLDFSDSLNTGTLKDRQNNALILINNYPWKTAIGLLQRLYSPFFATVVFCGTWNRTALVDETLSIQEPINYIYMSKEEMNRGFNYHFCFSKARDLRLQNITGYFFVSDDTIFNFWNEVPVDKVNLPISIDYHSLYYWNETYGQRTLELLNSTFKNDMEVQQNWDEMKRRVVERHLDESGEKYMTNFTGKTCNDFLYVPTGYMDYFSNMIEVLVLSEMFVENAMPKLLHTVDLDRGKGFISSWAEDRGYNLTNYKETYLGLHPVKMSTFEKDLQQRKHFCDNVIDRFVKEIFGN